MLRFDPVSPGGGEGGESECMRNTGVAKIVDDIESSFRTMQRV